MMLEKYYDAKVMAKLLLPREEYKPFPKYKDRDAWAKVYPKLRAQYLDPKFKKRIMDFDTPALTATAYMEWYRTNGNGEDKWSPITQPRRDFLWDAVLAECFEGKGEYIDKIIDILWAICEETTWIPPAHINHMHNHMYTGILKNALPDVTEYNFIDLYAGICGGVLGWTYYFLKDRLDEESPLLAKRIEVELYKKIIIPFMTHDDLTWFGFYGHKINNWNPWILSSIIPAGLTVIKDEEYRAEFMARAMEKFDIYVKNCAPDGGSDEGPSYWNVGGAQCLDVFEIIEDATGGKIQLLNTQFARNLGEYIAHANMTGDLYANFADSGMKQSPGYFTYYYAGKTGSEYLKEFALSRNNIKSCPAINIVSMYRNLKMLFEYDEVPQDKPTEFVHKDVWLPDSQHLYVRTNDNRVSLAAKGGYNNESHNHNDLGSFIYCIDGDAAINDLGGLSYTARAFSPFRYNFWIVQSTAHNCVRIGKYQQHDGDMYKAREVEHMLGKDRVALKLELKKAYEEEAGIRTYTRAFDFDKLTGRLEITDDILLENAADADIHFVTVHKVEVSDNSVYIVMKNGRKVRISCDGGEISLERHYNMTREFEHFMRDEEVLKDGTKCDCTRIVFTFAEPVCHRIIKTEITHD